jgi:hypothetical protein
MQKIKARTQAFYDLELENFNQTTIEMLSWENNVSYNFSLLCSQMCQNKNYRYL